MTTYVFGDIQGCLDPLKRLLDKLDCDMDRDTFWFVGDLVNRGPQSLEALRFIHSLPNKQVVLGNHDLTLLAIAYADKQTLPKDTLEEILAAPDKDELLQWLRHQQLMHYDKINDAVLAHAGIYPSWNLDEALAYAGEVEHVLQGDDFVPFLKNMYGNQPDRWDASLTGWERLRFITNTFTRMRFVSEAGALDLNAKGTVEPAPRGYKPWYTLPTKNITANTRIIFGHWAALEGVTHHAQAINIDTGCVWGAQLTAYCLETKQRTYVDCAL